MRSLCGADNLLLYQQRGGFFVAQRQEGRSPVSAKPIMVQCLCFLQGASLLRTLRVIAVR